MNAQPSRPSNTLLIVLIVVAVIVIIGLTIGIVILLRQRRDTPSPVSPLITPKNPTSKTPILSPDEAVDAVAGEPVSPLSPGVPTVTDPIIFDNQSPYGHPLVTVYENTAFKGRSARLFTVGKYPIGKCPSTLPSLGFKPHSALISTGYIVGLRGWWEQEGDDECGPTTEWTQPATDKPLSIPDLFTENIFGSWAEKNVNGYIVVETI